MTPTTTTHTYPRPSGAQQHKTTTEGRPKVVPSVLQEETQCNE